MVKFCKALWQGLLNDKIRKIMLANVPATSGRIDNRLANLGVYLVSKPFGVEEEIGMQYGPNQHCVFPNEKLPELCFIKNTITRKNIIVGDYTYYDDKNGADKFEEHVTHHYEFIGDKLMIGKFCSIASGVKFIMNGANHNMNGFSTYPFNIFCHGWEKVTPALSDLPLKGDTVIGNDVWIGQNVTILPGVKIGDGAIIGANAVVASDIPAYCIAVGNPCKVVKKRFDDNTIELLEKLQWWNWNEKKIFDNLEAIIGRDINKLINIK